jgi:DNA-directed RNA polymerase specialized sigma24 family protein
LKPDGVHLADRLALRPKEAAEALGISDRTLRTWMRDGVSDLHEWMEERIEAERSLDELVDEVLDT